MEAGRADVGRFVLDASIAAVWFLPDEASGTADRALRRVEDMVAAVPDIFWHEMRNVLLISYRRSRISLPEVWTSMARLEQLEISTTPSANNSLILTLAERHGLTAYDAAYFALALDRQMPLATLDRRMGAAAAREGVPLLD